MIGVSARMPIQITTAKEKKIYIIFFNTFNVYSMLIIFENNSSLYDKSKLDKFKQKMLKNNLSCI